MQIGHQRRYIAMRQHKVLIHIERWDVVRIRWRPSIPASSRIRRARSSAAVRRFAVIGVHILPERVSSQVPDATRRRASSTTPRDGRENAPRV